MILWRPVGLAEMGLVFDSGMRRFPPRLPEQPIFYPVLAESYAAEIASGWNVRDEPHAGYVLRFELAEAYAAKFDLHVVGASVHRELWIPAAELDETNRHIVGDIRVEQAFFGPHFRGEIPVQGALRGKDARSQIHTISAMAVSSATDLAMEVDTNPRTVFLHYPFWKAAGSARFEITSAHFERCLAALRAAWEMFPRPAPLLEIGTAGYRPRQ
jgi:hypothetical protein